MAADDGYVDDPQTAGLPPRNYNELIARLGHEPVPAPKPPPPPPTVPAGWYPDPDNTTGFRYGGIPSMRFFDGVQWTEHRAPMQRPQVRFPQQPIMITQQVNGGSSSMVGLHLILTICTCGLWLPFWVIIEIIQAGTRR